MPATIRWCVIANQKASLRAVNKWIGLLRAHHIPHLYYVTLSSSDLNEVVLNAFRQQCNGFLFAGGDGTLHHGAQAILRNKPAGFNPIIGVLPCGTGNDWHRSFGLTSQQLIRSIQVEHIIPFPFLEIHFENGDKKYAFNMLGAGLDAAVVNTLNHSFLNKLGPLKYAIGLITTLTKPYTWEATIKTDGKIYSGKWMTIQAGFGKYCGSGMLVLPHAEISGPGLLLMRPKNLGNLLLHLPDLYNGKVIQHQEALAMNFTEVSVEHNHTPLPVEADGEWLGYSPFSIKSVNDQLYRLAISPDP